MEALIRDVLAGQQEVLSAVWTSNWLAVAGRIIELLIVVMLSVAYNKITTLEHLKEETLKEVRDRQR